MLPKGRAKRRERAFIGFPSCSRRHGKTALCVISYRKHGRVVKSVGSGATELESFSCPGCWLGGPGRVMEPLSLNVRICKVRIIPAPAPKSRYRVK